MKNHDRHEIWDFCDGMADALVALRQIKPELEAEFLDNQQYFMHEMGWTFTKDGNLTEYNKPKENDDDDYWDDFQGIF